MALTPSSDQKRVASEDVLLREVDDAVRQDQYADFGRRYGKPLLAALVLGLAAFGGYLYWDHRQEAAMERRDRMTQNEAGQRRVAEFAS